jgi:hypothetical protein
LIVIYGEYPPSAGPAAEATMELVRAHLAGGADVQVVSPLPSAAHHEADLGTVRGAALLARLTPGADLELALDPALLAKGRGWRAPAQALLALAISRARHSTVRLGPLRGPAGRGRVRLVLGSADSVVAASQLDAVALERAGIDPSRLSVRAAAVARPGTNVPTEPDGQVGLRERWGLSEDPGREELEATVRRRAAEDREAAAGNSAASTGPLHLLGPFVPPPSSGKPLVAIVKKVVYRLTSWVLLPLMEHINRLQQATIESMNGHAALSDHAGDRDVMIS